MRPTREEIKLQLKKLLSDKAAGPDEITNHILQAGGEPAVDMIYLYMLIIWEVQTYPGAWALALMNQFTREEARIDIAPPPTVASTCSTLSLSSLRDSLNLACHNSPKNMTLFTMSTRCLKNECDITHNERDMTHYSGTCLTR